MYFKNTAKNIEDKECYAPFQYFIFNTIYIIYTLFEDPLRAFKTLLNHWRWLKKSRSRCLRCVDYLKKFRDEYVDDIFI